MTLLVAQSVPSAERVPCFEPLPVGWHAATVEVDHDGTLIRFDSDRAGERAATFRYAAGCDHSAAVPAPSEHRGVDRFDFVERVAPRFRAERFYVFPGGCAWWQFDFVADASAALSIELGDRLVVVPRAELNDSIRTSFIDAEI